MKIENVKVYGIEDAVRYSKYPMLTNTENADSQITQTTKRLGSCATGTGHDNFLNGIIVQFELTFSIKAWTEAERYHFLDFISSQSTMHRIAQFGIKNQCNKYVSPDIIAVLEKLKKQYIGSGSNKDYLKLLYNIPVGFELSAGMTTNYRQLKTILQQRENHRLPEWREFCKWIRSLPRFEELCVREVK